MRNTFGKNERLKSQKAIGELFEKGKHINVYPLKLVWLTQRTDKPDKYPAKVVLSVSKKKFKKAVDRNRIKRLLKETYRTNKKELINTLNNKQLELHFFLVYLDKKLPEYQPLEDKIKIALERLIKEINNHDEI